MVAKMENEFAWLMIVLGVVFYLKEMGYLAWNFLSSEWAVVLIVFGLWKLYRGKH